MSHEVRIEATTSTRRWIVDCDECGLLAAPQNTLLKAEVIAELHRRAVASPADKPENAPVFVSQESKPE